MKIAGFTLIELLIVIAVLSILIAIVIPNYARFQEKAREAQVKANIHVTQVALESYAVDHNGYYPNNEDAWAETNDPTPKDVIYYFPNETYPTNPYTKEPEQPVVDTNRLKEPGQAGKTRSDEPGCPYNAYVSPKGPGAVAVLQYCEPVSMDTIKVGKEYGICGWGRNPNTVLNSPVGKGNNNVEICLVYFVRHNCAPKEKNKE